MPRFLTTTRIFLSALVVLCFVGCQTNGDVSTETSEPEQPQQDREETIAEQGENVNDQNGLEPEGGDESCPPPRETEQMCAQVITWASSPGGACCQYPSPCRAPEGWETFQSEEACLDASE